MKTITKPGEIKMQISMYQETFMDVSLDHVIQSLSEGLRANIPYSDSQVFTIARLTASIINGSIVDLYDTEFSGLDTVELIMELENGIRSVLETNYDSSVEHGAGIIAVYQV